LNAIVDELKASFGVENLSIGFQSKKHVIKIIMTHHFSWCLALTFVLEFNLHNNVIPALTSTQLVLSSKQALAICFNTDAHSQASFIVQVLLLRHECQEYRGNCSFNAN